MSIAYVGNLRGSVNAYYWYGNGPQSSNSYTPAAGNSIIAAGLDQAGTGKTISLTSTVGTYTNLGSINSLASKTLAGYASIGVANTAQVLTIDSSPSGDYMNCWAWEFSGVVSISLGLSTATSSSTAVGSISGTAVVVPTGSVLFAVCEDETRSIGNAPVLDNGTQAFTDYYCTLGVTFAGSGASVTPLFTPAGTATTNYTIFQYLLSPANITASAGMYAYTGQNATFSPTAILSAGYGIYAISGNTATFGVTSIPLVMLANSGTYDYVGDLSASDVSVPASVGAYTISGQNAALSLITARFLAASAGNYAINGLQLTFVLSTIADIAMPSFVGLPYLVALVAVRDTGFTSATPIEVTVAQSLATGKYGYVIEQNPVAGTLVVPGSEVTLTVNKGPGQFPSSAQNEPIPYWYFQQ